MLGESLVWQFCGHDSSPELTEGGLCSVLLVCTQNWLFLAWFCQIFLLKKPKTCLNSPNLPTLQRFSRSFLSANQKVLLSFAHLYMLQKPDMLELSSGSLQFILSLSWILFSLFYTPYCNIKNDSRALIVNWLIWSKSCMRTLWPQSYSFSVWRWILTY